MSFKSLFHYDVVTTKFLRKTRLLLWLTRKVRNKRISGGIRIEATVTDGVHRRQSSYGFERSHWRDRNLRGGAHTNWGGGGCVSQNSDQLRKKQIKCALVKKNRVRTAFCTKGVLHWRETSNRQKFCEETAKCYVKRNRTLHSILVFGHQRTAKSKGLNCTTTCSV